MNDSIRELEHYGVKGMKWDRSKRKKLPSPPKDERGDRPLRPSANLKPKQGGSANSPDASDSVFSSARRRARAAATADKVKRGLKIAAKQLGRVGGRSTRSIRGRTRSVGRGAINGVFRAIQRNSK